jgi:hypothetical protein
MLTFWSVFAFVAHHHANGAESAKCRVCVAAYSAVSQTTANLSKVTFTSVSAIQSEPLSAKQRFVVFALSVRPPPAV